MDIYFGEQVLVTVAVGRMRVSKDPVEDFLEVFIHCYKHVECRDNCFHTGTFVNLFNTLLPIK